MGWEVVVYYMCVRIREVGGCRRIGLGLGGCNRPTNEMKGCRFKEVSLQPLDPSSSSGDLGGKDILNRHRFQTLYAKILLINEVN